jgi:hypothetical protein
LSMLPDDPQSDMGVISWGHWNDRAQRNQFSH